jgi:hypothetical protein
MNKIVEMEYTLYNINIWDARSILFISISEMGPRLGNFILCSCHIGLIGVQYFVFLEVWTFWIP